MNTSELYDRFRKRSRDKSKPYFWDDDEVFDYMNLAYRKFVRLIGGVSDFTSNACSVPIVTGEANGALDASILRVMSAQRASDYGDIEIINQTDLGKLMLKDYGNYTPLRLDDTTGIVRKGVMGLEKGLIRWIFIPEVDDTAQLVIKRLPLDTLSSFDQDISDVEEDHHLALLDGMMAEALLKQDAETFDLGKSEDFEGRFRAYAAEVKAELERYEFKPRTVQYGGL